MATISKQTVLAGLAVIYMAGSTFAAIRFYDLYKLYEAKVPKSEKEVEKEAAEITLQLKKIMEVPDEKPVIATVKDKDTLKAQQAFFAQAENGDKLVVFQGARKAILYRPSIAKIIESGPLLVSPDNQQQGQQQVQPVKMMIYNGTTQEGLAKVVEDNLKKAAGPLLQTFVDTAQSTDYQKTLVVDITGNNKQSVDEVAKFLNGEVGTLPQGEKRPDADILVILGTQR